MVPIKSIDDVFKNWGLFERWEGIYACFLYTEEDKNLAAYVRENYSNLGIMSGHHCLIFLIDEPERLWSVKEGVWSYWKDFQSKMEPEFRESKPFGKEHAYQIAQCFGIPPATMPCVILFKNLRDTGVLPFRINAKCSAEDLSGFFRDLFSVMEFPMTRDEIKKEALWQRMQDYHRASRMGAAISRLPNTLNTIGELLKILRAFAPG